MIYGFCSLFLMTMMIGCSESTPQGPGPSTEEPFTLSSSTFADGGSLPEKYTCKGEAISPSLSFSNLPKNTQSLVIMMENVDAKEQIFDHWLIWNLPPTIQTLSENVPGDAEVSGLEGARQGHTDFNQIGYRSPCPPEGTTYRYEITALAVDKKINLISGAVKRELLWSLKGNILARDKLVVTVSG